MDLPFAQRRWCGTTGVDKVEVFSDYKDVDFGTKYGVIVKETGLLARSLFIVDKEGIIGYIQLVLEVTDEPNYEEVLNVVGELV